MKTQKLYIMQEQINRDMSYNNILSFGDFIPLKITCDVSKLFDEIKEYKYYPLLPY